MALIRQISAKVDDLRDTTVKLFRVPELSAELQRRLAVAALLLAVMLIVFYTLRKLGPGEAPSGNYLDPYPFGVGCFAFEFMIVIRCLRSIRTNTSSLCIRMLVALSYLCIGSGALILGILPSYLFPLIFFPLVISSFFEDGASWRMDSSLFVRARTTGAPELIEPVKIHSSLTDQQLKGFARFLGTGGVVGDYILTKDHVQLKLGREQSLFWFAFPSLIDSSTVTVFRGGECSATLGRSDRKSLRGAMQSAVEVEELQNRVARSVQAALVEYLGGNLPAARSTIAGQPDDRELQKAQNMVSQRIAGGFSIAVLLWLTVASYLFFERHVAFWPMSGGS